MKITATIRAQAVYSLAASVFATVPIFDLADRLKARYSFRHTPTGQELVNPPPNQPLNFLWGQCNLPDREAVAIESLQVQNYAQLATGVSVITRTSTDDSDAVLKDLREWVAGSFSVNVKPVFPTYYLSQLEFILDRPIAEQLKMLMPLSELVTRLVRGYGFTACPAWEPSAVYLFFDNSRLTTPPTFAQAFIVDRRAGASYDENRYYSQAPLKTSDHKRALEELERALKQG
ncbi:MAG: hypothetical protein WA005_03460 [Candidatus Binataceae bacterium]